MNRPTISEAQAWRPDLLRDAARAWKEAATGIHARIDAAVGGVASTDDFWSGAAADSARRRAHAIARASDAQARAMVLAAVAAADGAARIESTRADVLALVNKARSDGFAVADDGTVSVSDGPSPLLVALSGGDDAVGREMLAVRAQELTRRIVDGLDRLATVDADVARELSEAFAAASATPQFDTPATVPAGAWPVAAGDVVAGWTAMSQQRIADQIAAMTPEQRQRLVAEFPHQVGNTDGVPWDMRIDANRTNVAQAILDEPDVRRAAFYRTLLQEIDDPTRSGRRVDRQILAFDPVRGSLIELNGDLARATSVAVFVPGMNTTLEGSAANTATARRFVSATRGQVAAITYLGGPFPGGSGIAGLADAASPRYALDMAPRLAAFSEDVDRTVDAMAAGRRPVPVTYIGHSYGGSILGTAEALGLTADRTMYVAAAGAGVGVDDPGDWHNRNPHVQRYSMTAPGDWIQAVQGLPGGPHGADPDEMEGVIPLATGHYDDGRPMEGPRAHTDVLNWPSTAWRNVLAVITGDSETLHEAG